MLAAATEDNQTQEVLTIAPPSSMKLFRTSENKADLLALGLAGNSLLRRKITPESEAWLVANGWTKPQEPFNPHFAMLNRGDLTLEALLELAVESWVVAYQVTPNTPFAMHLSLFDQNEIAAKYLTMDPATFLFTLPGFEPNVRFEPVPQKKSRSKAAKKETPAKSPAEATSPTKTPGAKAALRGTLSEGDRVCFDVNSPNGPLLITGTYLGQEKGKARVQVTGNKEIPDNVYAVPSDSLRPAD